MLECSLNGKVAGLVHGGAIHQVAHILRVDGSGQRRARSVLVRLDVLRVVDGVAGLVQWGAVRKVANVVHEDGGRQRGSWSMAVRPDVLRVVDVVSGPVHGGAVRQVADVVAELQAGEGVPLEAVGEVSGMPHLRWGCRRRADERCGNHWGLGWGRHGSCWSGHGTTPHGVVASRLKGSAIHQVANVSLVGGGRQRGAWRVRVRLHGLRMVDGVTGRIERSAIGQVAWVAVKEL